MAKETVPVWEKRLQRRWTIIAGFALAFWTVTSTTALGFWTVYVWRTEQEKARLQKQDSDDKLRIDRLHEAQAPFKAKKFELYMEAAEVAGKLVSLDPNDDNWKEAYNHCSNLLCRTKF